MIRFLLILFFLFAAAPGYSQYRDAGSLPSDTLATVGTRAITSRDLLERIELMPWPGKDKPTQMDSAKIKALQSLAAEAILSMESAAQGIVDDSTFRMHSRNVEKLMVRDELYKREVRAKVSVTPQEISQGLKRFARQVKALMINTGSQSEAAALAQLLRGGARLDSLSRVKRLVIDTASVRFALLEKSQEDVVYSLSSGKPVSDPVNVPRLGWVVLYLLDIFPDPEYAKLSQDERQQTVQQKITRRKEAVRAASYVTNELASRRAEAKPATFQLLATTLFDLLAGDTALYRSDKGYRLDKVAPAAEARLRPHLHDGLVELEGEVLTLQDVLEAWRNFDFYIPTLEKKEFLRQVNGAVREVVVREILTREGFRRKLEQTESVQHDVDVWMNAWLASALSQKLVNGVNATEKEVMDYLVSHPDEIGNDYLVNVRELLSDSLSTALSMLERVVRGEDFRKLCQTFSKRKGWAERGGESGYFAAARVPEIGFLALESDTGKINGPVRTGDGYSIFAVLGKKQREGKNVISYDSLKGLVKEQLLSDKMDERLDEFVAAVAKNYPVTLYYDRLRQLSISPVNMVTKRMIGFGGTMPASPGLMPMYRWVDQAASVRQIYP
jgi:parvulin-like peptidyl-prolyl isomerase